MEKKEKRVRLCMIPEPVQGVEREMDDAAVDRYNAFLDFVEELYGKEYPEATVGMVIDTVYGPATVVAIDIYPISETHAWFGTPTMPIARYDNRTLAVNGAEFPAGTILQFFHYHWLPSERKNG